MEDLKLRRRNLIMFPLGAVGRDMVYALITNFLLTYILFTRGLSAAQLTAVTAIMVGARVFDALNDPIMGNIIERTRTRWGKFKPWLVAGILFTSVVIYLTFNTDLQGWSFIWFFGINYFLFSIAYTMHDISYWGMVPALSSDANARNQFTARATLFAGIGSTAANIFIPMLTTGKNTIGGSANIAYGRIALVICLLAPLFLCFTVFGVREQRSYSRESAPRVSFKKIIGTFTGNNQLLWISLIFLIQSVGNGIVLSGIGCTYIYFDFGYEGGLFSLFTTIGMLATAFLMIFYPMISRHITRKKLMSVMMCISTVGYMLMLIPGLVMGSTMLKFWILVIGYMAANFGQYGFYLIMMISIMNTIEYNEYLYGIRDEAIIASFRPFLTKLASALTVVIASGSYMIFGVTDYSNQISALERAASSGAISETEKLSRITGILGNVRHGQTLGLLLCITVLPFVLMFISYLLYKKHYKLDEDEYQRICAEITRRAGGGET